MKNTLLIYNTGLIYKIKINRSRIDTNCVSYIEYLNAVDKAYRQKEERKKRQYTIRKRKKEQKQQKPQEREIPSSDKKIN